MTSPPRLVKFCFLGNLQLEEERENRLCWDDENQDLNTGSGDDIVFAGAGMIFWWLLKGTTILMPALVMMMFRQGPGQIFLSEGQVMIFWMVKVSIKLNIWDLL